MKCKSYGIRFLCMMVCLVLLLDMNRPKGREHDRSESLLDPVGRNSYGESV